MFMESLRRPSLGILGQGTKHGDERLRLKRSDFRKTTCGLLRSPSVTGWSSFRPTVISSAWLRQEIYRSRSGGRPKPDAGLEIKSRNGKAVDELCCFNLRFRAGLLTVPEFKPFVPHDSTEPEFTAKAVVAGILLAAVFGAANAYLGMKAGQTVAATIPAAVIAIALFRLPFFRGGVLEQNLTRTAASVGEALVAGAIFTIPAFMMVNVGGVRLWQDLRNHYWVGTLILLAGGLLGIFFIIILRRPLCVESVDLPCPESTASAEIVTAAQQRATDAPKYIFGALGLGAFLQVLKDEKGFQVFKDSVSFFVSFPKSAIGYFGYQKEAIGTVTYTGGIAYTTPSASPALMGIGYIIGPRLAAINFSGGVIAGLLLIPLVLFIDPDLPARLGATTGGRAPWDLVSYTVWYNVVRPIAVGAMLVGTVYTLYSMRESILRSIRGAFEASAKGDAGRAARTRLDIDIPIKWIIVAIAALVIPITIIYYHFAGSWSAAILAALVMTVTGFF